MGQADDKLPGRATHAIGELFAAIVLSIAALLTSWAGFQAALWDGEQAAFYTRAGAARIHAGMLAMEGGQSEAVDLFLFTQWLNAFAERETQLQAFYRARFRPDFAKAFEAWMARNPHSDVSAPPTPFAMVDYVPRHAREARAMDAEAQQLFDQGERANQISDSFAQATVILALALFLGGIGQTFKRLGVRLLLNGIGTGACALGAIKLLALPAMSL